MKKLICFVLVLALLLPALALADIDARMERVLGALVSGDAAALDEVYQDFSADMQKGIPRESLGALLGQLEAAMGAYQGAYGDTQCVQQGSMTVLSQPLSMAGLSDLNLTLVLNGEGKIAGLSVQPAAKPVSDADQALPDGVTESDITVGEGQWALPGTLTLPVNAENCPAVVLVHGSGPNDRDETIGANKPFRDIAWYLASRGIAVLRYDKRTYAHSAAIVGDADALRAFTVEEETIQDAISAGRLLAGVPGVDAGRVFVAGHSLGAMLAPRIASEGAGVFCGMALLCGSPLPLWKIMLRQNQTNIELLDDVQRAPYQALIDQEAQKVETVFAGSKEEALGQTLFGQPAYYFYEMKDYSAADTLASLALPTLIVNGGRDFQVTEEEGRIAWESALDESAPWLTTYFAQVNHLLIDPKIPYGAAGAAGIAGTQAEYNIPGEVDAGVLGALADFILNP